MQLRARQRTATAASCPQVAVRWHSSDMPFSLMSGAEAQA